MNSGCRGCEVFPRVRDAFRGGHESIVLGFNLSQPWEEAGFVGYLDVEAWSCVQFKDQGSLILVQDYVHALIPQSGKLVATGSQFKQSFPVRDLYPGEAAARVGVLLHRLVSPD